MNKAELVEAIAAKSDLTKAAANRALDACLETIIKAVSTDDAVVLTGFGTFESAKRAARTGRNPSTGAEIKIPSTKVPKFKPGKAFKDAVKGGK